MMFLTREMTNIKFQNKIFIKFSTPIIFTIILMQLSCAVATNYLVSNGTKTNDVDCRLPKTIRPISYDIKIIPFLMEKYFHFNGTVRIIVECLEDTKNITMNAVNLNINENDVIVKNIYRSNQLLSIKKQYFIKEKEFFIIEFDEKLEKHHYYEISIKYNVQTIDNNVWVGFYRMSYKVGNETRFIAATQFSPTDARRAFPCFDEPALKAKFLITIARPTNMTTLSNMPKIGKSTPVIELPSYVWDFYQETIPMSTYLVAFVVIDFENKTSGRFNVWSRSEKINLTSYALDVAPKLLNYYEKLLDINFPLPKIDMVALPNVKFAAMEHWGLITFEESALFYEDGILMKFFIFEAISHEIVHQWFGNLVTPSDWSYLWIKEGFTTYLQYLSADVIEPTWMLKDKLMVSKMHTIFEQDSHALSKQVSCTKEIKGKFDSVSYKKGAIIVRMMKHFLTTEVFFRGITNILKKFYYKSVNQNDLWEILIEEAKQSSVLDNSVTVKEIMDTWTLQPGFPVVTVTRNYENNFIHLTQSHFISELTTNETKPREDLIWWIPLTYTTSNDLNFKDTQPMYWMNGVKELTINDIVLTNNNWIIFNIQQTGYYRVNYDNKNWKMIIKHLRDPELFQDITDINRAQLLDDALSLARAGYLDYDIALDLTTYLEHETDYLPWEVALREIFYFKDILKDEKNEVQDKFKKYLFKLVNKYFEMEFYDPKIQDPLSALKRRNLFFIACNFDFPKCIDASKRLFHEWMEKDDPENDNPISKEIKYDVFCTANKHGSVQEWQWTFKRFLNTTKRNEKLYLLYSFDCVENSKLLNEYLENAMKETFNVTMDDILNVVKSQSKYTFSLSNSFANYWKYFIEYLEQNQNLKKEINSLATNDDFKLIKELIKKTNNKPIKSSEIKKKTLREKPEWLKEQIKVIVKWIDNLK